jgi:hypothetical protein
MRRTAVVDMELRGKQIRAGDKVIHWYSSADRGEELFAIPSVSTSRVSNPRISASASASTSASARGWRSSSYGSSSRNS